MGEKLKQFFGAFRAVSCEGCGKPLTECNRKCQEWRDWDREYYWSIK